MLATLRNVNDPETLQNAIIDHLYYLLGRSPATATMADFYLAVAWVTRDRLMQRWMQTQTVHDHLASRRLFYVSAEYLPGPHLRNALCSLNLEDTARAALAGLGLDLEEVAKYEPEPGLGSTELARLAACDIDSMATLEIPAIAYGVRYEFGLFEQKFCNQRQLEIAQKWLRMGNPWEILRSECAYTIGFGGCTEHYKDASGNSKVRWLPERFVKGIAYDTPIPGYNVETVNLLRLWSAEAYENFEIQTFNLGEYQRAIGRKASSELISKILFLDDEPGQSNVTRLEQHYFLAACVVADAMRIYLQRNSNLTQFANKINLHINDAGTTLVIAELMRLLVDEYALSWDDAWKIVYNTTTYANHSIALDALERWPVELFAALLPRHLEIIYEINHRFLQQVRNRWANDQAWVIRLSLFDEQGGKRLRMTHLGCVGSHSISGLLDRTSQLPHDPTLRDFYEFNAEQFIAISNGVSPRRFLRLANPSLARLITETIGTDWIHNSELLNNLTPHAESSNFRDAWKAIKYANKQRLAADIKSIIGFFPNLSSIFDIQVKRIREYKRQHLNILHIINHYFALKDNPNANFWPRVWLFAGKAAPGAFLAQLILELILGVAKKINSDQTVKDRMCLAFLPNFEIKDISRIYPAADLSEQITTAGKESSGAGTIKFALNGALTIGSHDGVNVEIQATTGPNNFFAFGMNEMQLRQMRAAGYRPSDYYASNAELRNAIDAIAKGYFSNGDQSRFRPLLDAMLNWDSAFALADFASYVQCQHAVNLAWADTENWTRSSILNTAGAGYFSSDHTILKRCQHAWQVQPLPINLNEKVN